jgi:hypothetical protein
MKFLLFHIVSGKSAAELEGELMSMRISWHASGDRHLQKHCLKAGRDLHQPASAKLGLFMPFGLHVVPAVHAHP